MTLTAPQLVDIILDKDLFILELRTANQSLAAVVNEQAKELTELKANGRPEPGPTA